MIYQATFNDSCLNQIHVICKFYYLRSLRLLSEIASRRNEFIEVQYCNQVSSALCEHALKDLYDEISCVYFVLDYNYEVPKWISESCSSLKIIDILQPGYPIIFLSVIDDRMNKEYSLIEELTRMQRSVFSNQDVYRPIIDMMEIECQDNVIIADPRKCNFKYSKVGFLFDCDHFTFTKEFVMGNTMSNDIFPFNQVFRSENYLHFNSGSCSNYAATHSNDIAYIIAVLHCSCLHTFNFSRAFENFTRLDMSVFDELFQSYFFGRKKFCEECINFQSQNTLVCPTCLSGEFYSPRILQ